MTNNYNSQIDNVAIDKGNKNTQNHKHIGKYTKYNYRHTDKDMYRIGCQRNFYEKRISCPLNYKIT